MPRLRAILTLALFVVACGDEPVSTTLEDASVGSDTAVADTAASDAIPSAETSPPPTPPCNPILQQGCSEGQNCTYSGDNTSPSCTPGGEKLYGQECAGQGDCAQGTCLDLNGTGNFCYKFCKTEVHCSGVAPGPGGKAFAGPCLELTGAPYRVCQLDVDYDTCNLLSQDCADATKGCYVVSGEPAPVCLPAGDSPVGGQCQSPSDCAPSTVCVNQRCYRLCSDASECETTFAQCSSYYGTVGICEEQ